MFNACCTGTCAPRKFGLSMAVTASYIRACTGHACLKVAEASGRCTDLSGPWASVGDGNLGNRCDAMVCMRVA